MIPTRKKPARPTSGSATAAGMVLVGLLLAGPSTAQEVDTSEWICEFCPFNDGADGEVEVAAVSVSDDSAWLGDATGYDEEGVRPDLDGAGSIVGDGHRLAWFAEDLGFDARSAGVEGDVAGTVDYHLAYRELPRRRYITTETIFVEDSVDRLSLPGDWQPAATTGGMTGLASRLGRRDIASDRQTLDAGAGYRFLDAVRLSVDYRRHAQEGVRLGAGPLFTSSAELPLPVDYRTDEVGLNLEYATPRGHVALGWYLSDFSNSGTVLTWDNPFTAVPGAGTLSLARAPDNTFRQLRLAAGLAFPAQRTWLRVSAASGRGEQDQAYLAYTTNPAIATLPLPAASLDGEVDTTNYAISVTSRPYDRVTLRASFRRDERDNRTPILSYTRVIADTFASGESETNTPYSFDRSTLKAEGEYDLLDTLELSAGFERRDVDRDFREVASQSEDTGWLRARWQPLDTLGIDARGGSSRRGIGRYDESLAVALGQNPLLRKYDLAFRYREFGELRADWSPVGIPVSAGVGALFTDDSYRRSELGITDGSELAVTADLGFTLSESATMYVNASVEELDSTQLGSAAFASADWRAAHEDRFESLGAGLRLRSLAERMDVEFDYLRTEGRTRITGGPPGGDATAFPDISSTYDLLRLAVDYRRSASLSLTADLHWRRFDMDDWALAAVGPATLPTVLGLGADPWDESVLVVAIGARYRFGKTGEE